MLKIGILLMIGTHKQAIQSSNLNSMLLSFENGLNENDQKMF